MRKRIRRHVYLHGKEHYTIEPYVKCVSTRQNFTVWTFSRGDGINVNEDYRVGG